MNNKEDVRDLATKDYDLTARRNRLFRGDGQPIMHQEGPIIEIYWEKNYALRVIQRAIDSGLKVTRRTVAWGNDYYIEASEDELISCLGLVKQEIWL